MNEGFIWAGRIIRTHVRAEAAPMSLMIADALSLLLATAGQQRSECPHLSSEIKMEGPVQQDAAKTN